MGIAILVIVVCVVLFTIGRGGGRTTADLVNTGEKFVKVTPVVAHKAADTAKVLGHKSASAAGTAKTAVGVTAINTKQAASKGFASFKESYKAARAESKVS